MDTPQENEKLAKLPAGIIEIFTELAIDDSLYNDLIFFGVDKFVAVSAKKENVLNALIEIEADKKRDSAKDVLKAELGFKDVEINQVIENLQDGLWEELDEVYKEMEEEEASFAQIIAKTAVSQKENPLESAKLAEEGHISHLDILGEIENPTPSIKTTATFQNSESKPALASVISTEQTKPAPPTSITQKSPNPTNTTSLHSPTPVAPYTNPALNIGTKLDQKLSAPSSSIPKDVYVSKKPDPYHEPVDL